MFLKKEAGMISESQDRAHRLSGKGELLLSFIDRILPVPEGSDITFYNNWYDPSIGSYQSGNQVISREAFGYLKFADRQQ